MDSRASSLLSLLMDLEMHMRNAKIWHSVEPSPEALASVQPFCVDTLDFSQWLQFVFIMRLRALAESGGMLPAECNVEPMVEEAFSELTTEVRSRLATTLSAIDTLLRSG